MQQVSDHQKKKNKGGCRVSTFAKNTSVPVGRTQEEIKRILLKYGASGFMVGQGNGQAVVVFEMFHRRVKFVLPVPKANDSKGEQVERTRWRCLLLAIKAKLECAATGITTFEQEFLAHIVLPNGQTVSDVMTPQLQATYSSGKMPPLLGHSQGGQ
jgi:hypothetical protein